VTRPLAAPAHVAAGTQIDDLYTEHCRMVLGLCRSLLRDTHEAQDASQQTFLSAYRSLLAGARPRDTGAWIATIARNECRARIRKRMSTPLPVDVEPESGRADPADLADERAELRI
jgi:DNA-directed RNA polymerase specialized sigma24 family protein